MMTSLTVSQVNSIPLNEANLVVDAQNGDVRAFNQLVSSYQDRIFNLAVRILGDADLADDITQNTFLVAYLNLHNFRNGSFRSWLYRIATNACYDEFRKHKKYTVLSIDDQEVPEERLVPLVNSSTSSDLPEAETERHELEQLVQSALSQLQPEHRAVVVLVDLQELDYREAAQVLGIPVGTVKSRLARARLRLQQILSVNKDFTY